MKYSCFLSSLVLLSQMACSQDFFQNIEEGSDNLPPITGSLSVMDLPQKTAGALYLYPVGKMRSESGLDILLASVADCFLDEAGIRFTESRVLQEGEFPPVNGLDILLYFLTKDDAEEAGLSLSGDPSLGRYGIGYAALDERNVFFDVPEYDRAGSFIGYPYSLSISTNNTGFVVFNEACAGSFEDTRRTMVHEVAHGLGAAHLLNEFSFLWWHEFEVSTSPYFYMSWSSCKNPLFYDIRPLFDVRNEAKMHYFINLVREKNLSLEQTIVARAKSIHETVLVPGFR